MRIAWLGPLGDDGGVPSMGKSLMEGVLARGIAIDFYSSLSTEFVHEMLGPHPLLRHIPALQWFQWGKWYSKTPFRAFLSGFLSRTQSHNAICDMLVANNRREKYDLVMHFSQMELLSLKNHMRELPPVVVYPCVHAAGEWTWHRQEKAYDIAAKGKLRHYIVRMFLRYRVFVQKKQSHLPAMMIGMSKRFNELIARDYGLPARRLRVLYHPIEPAPPSIDQPIENRKVRVVFAGRISVRKGVEMAIELSQRLNDLADQVEIDIIGGHTQWSDYRKHLSELNPRTAKYLGGLNNCKLLEVFAKSDVLITPSHYEPGGIVVGEAASRGMCIVASDEVGSAEPLSGEFILKFKAGDMDAFERCTREMIARVKANRVALAQAARAAAAAEFEPSRIADQLVDLLKAASQLANPPK